MTDITATLNPTDQSSVSTMVGNIYSSIGDLESKVSFMGGAIFNASLYCTDQDALNMLSTAQSNLLATTQLLHKRLNTLAIKGEDAFALTRGTWHGAAGTYHSDSGGTDKP